MDHVLHGVFSNTTKRYQWPAIFQEEPALKNGKSKDNKPKQPQSAYLYFCSAMREQVCTKAQYFFIRGYQHSLHVESDDGSMQLHAFHAIWIACTDEIVLGGEVTEIHSRCDTALAGQKWISWCWLHGNHKDHCWEMEDRRRRCKGSIRAQGRWRYHSLSDRDEQIQQGIYTHDKMLVALHMLDSLLCCHVV